MCWECALQRVTKCDTRMLSCLSHHNTQDSGGSIAPHRHSVQHMFAHLRNTYKGAADRTMSVCAWPASTSQQRNSRQRYGHCARPLEPSCRRSSADAAVANHSCWCLCQKHSCLHCCCCGCCASLSASVCPSLPLTHPCPSRVSHRGCSSHPQASGACQPSTVGGEGQAAQPDKTDRQQG